MLILGIDTSTDICSIGLCQSRKFLGEINIKLKRRHSERLLPLIDRLLSESGYDIQDINGVAVTKGPGSFTGLRIGLSTVQAFKQSLDIPVYSVSTLQYMAFSISHYYNKAILIPTIDALNKRVYTALFRRADDNLNRMTQDKAVQIISLIEDINDYNFNKIIFGSGANQYFQLLKKANLKNSKLITDTVGMGGFNLALMGYHFIKDGHDTEFAELVPKYLKKPQARLNWEKKYLQGDEDENIS